MKSNTTQAQLVNIPKLIEVIKILRVKRLELLTKLPDDPLGRDRILRELSNKIVAQVGIDDYLTLTAVDALIFILDKPYADSTYISLINDLEQLSKLKLQELRLEPRSLYEVKITVKLQKLPQDEFKQHIQALKSMKFKFDELLKYWFKIYEAGKPAVHPLA
jgi:hypothetical protein